MEQIDPVCGMKVNPTTSKYKTIYKGKIYYFCSFACLKEFEKNAELYLREGPRKMPT
ncbi:MAG: YHS domain-containing protein [Desulfurococcaceae archaeon]